MHLVSLFEHALDADADFVNIVTQKNETLDLLKLAESPYVSIIFTNPKITE